MQLHLPVFLPRTSAPEQWLLFLLSPPLQTPLLLTLDPCAMEQAQSALLQAPGPFCALQQAPGMLLSAAGPAYPVASSAVYHPLRLWRCRTWGSRTCRVVS
jgi:hypothetical protein